MKRLILTFLFLSLCIGAWAQEDCNKLNQLLNGYGGQLIPTQLCREANANERIANALEKIAERLGK